MMKHSEISVYNIKVGLYSKLNEYMEIYMYQRSRSFFDLCPMFFRMKMDLRQAVQDLYYIHHVL